MLSLLLLAAAWQFVEIPQVIETVMEAHKADFTAEPSIDDIVNVSLFCVRMSWTVCVV